MAARNRHYGQTENTGMVKSVPRAQFSWDTFFVRHCIYVDFKGEWWARRDSNPQPDRYERSALTN